MSSRPNRFILNSDYMSLAQAGNQEIDIVLPAGTSISGLGYVTKLVNLPAVKGAIPRYLVSYETTVYNMETQQTETKTVTIPTEGMFDIWSLLRAFRAPRQGQAKGVGASYNPERRPAIR